jgi:hypothetical protein
MMASSRLPTALLVIAFARDAALRRRSQTAVCTRRFVVLASAGEAELKTGKQQPPNKFGLCRKRARV